VGRNLLWPIWGDAAAAERLTIRSGEAVTREGRETYAVEYKLTDRWSLVGEYDRFGELNAGVKWRVYSK
jgi:translocation and assembly module TamB